MAPEVVSPKKDKEVYGRLVDVWACGAIIAEMLTGRALFQGDSEIDQLHRIFRYHLPPFAPFLFVFEASAFVSGFGDFRLFN